MCYTHMQTRSGGHSPKPTHGYNTRSKDKAPTGTRIARPFVPPVGPEFFGAEDRRPRFERETEEKLYAHPKKIGNVNYYECETAPGITKWLPRKKDATVQQKRAGDFATIGHQIQWQDYVTDKCSPETGTYGSYQYEAYKKADVKKYYNETGNLKLQSMSYNSSIAKKYDGTSPLTPTWVEE